MEEYLECKNALEGQGAIIARLFSNLTQDQWQMATKLAGWNIFTLAAHMLRAPDVLIKYATDVVQTPPELNWITYWNFDGPAIAAAVSQRAIDSSANTSPKALPHEFTQVLMTALVMLDGLSPHTVIQSARGTITLLDFAITRVVELTIHTFDLTEALGLPAQFDPSAQQLTVETLEALLNQERPAMLTDDVDFIAAASGRRRYGAIQISAFKN